ncbi:MAG: hypothetical protein A3G52_01045 [Candidatus Taylorbacteria bacterium RIFCSPLOWO2_12_FULL_43_20]|uniref:Uncharacterized protein n=1 Tax=Candidatus Taylorbacteria bacterium RIFCSPLOWO2_12_FULL_43_20 TaxID=1802332 RepID=A0A1G2P5J4_9BACT|nr:MAG: hypothetical protein A3H58_00345 [Candidatus Taylorbacteria bacterium RIFCSPLOWO2_02_FULL_43_22b]OHA42841.1 MAG: hypothetical protein A3G52_01045 [Candidatus Taylorbacteria bacterium RIFCSPLOWO2_12_FULL_43_20]
MARAHKPTRQSGRQSEGDKQKKESNPWRIWGFNLVLEGQTWAESKGMPDSAYQSAPPPVE